MDYSTCYNCGQQGHFASSCPLGIDMAPTGGLPANHPPAWKNPPRRDTDEQTRINEQGAALCRMMLTQRGNVST